LHPQRRKEPLHRGVAVDHLQELVLSGGSQQFEFVGGLIHQSVLRERVVQKDIDFGAGSVAFQVAGDDDEAGGSRGARQDRRSAG